ncbi:response regulator transcription factor [Amycolatopsis pigmentata]|uniref:Response regulator transcription factor n=1 Tax=Amycolatopsis pigmentata TaxID=450801 RepID=A0ABW5FYD9_9PSEU
MEIVEVLVHASDVISRAGVEAMLASSPRLSVVSEDAATSVDVVVLVVHGVAGREDFASLGRFQRYTTSGPRPRCVVVADGFRTEDMLAGVMCGVAAVLNRVEARDDVLVSAVEAVGAGAALMPDRLQGVFLEQVARFRAEVLGPQGLTLTGLDTRERDVLQLVAEGYQTEEIAKRLAYSEGMVRNVLYGLMDRLGSNSRSHAVAHAMRAGMI